MIARRIRALTLVAAASAAAGVGPAAAQQAPRSATSAGQSAQPAALPRTWQEEQNFRSGPTPYAPLMKFWYELDAMSPLVSLQPLTRTLLGRDMVVAVIAEPAITNAEDAIRSGKTIVLLAPSVHGGEVSPKESVQLIARDLASGPLRPLLKDVIVLALPLVNPDGGEVRRRTNEAGYDMNRDYLKLESQEVGALVTQVMREWTPDIHVDGHHGGSAPYVITYQGTLNPAADSALRAYPYDVIFPRIQRAVRAEDYAAFDYSGTRTENGVLGWGSTSVEPRKHHVYTGLTNSIGILLETPSNSARVMRDGTVRPIPQEERYYHQIRGGVLAMREILTVAAEQRARIRALTTGARMRAIEAGSTGGDPIVLDYTVGSRGSEPVWMPDSTAPGGYRLRTVPVYLKWTPTRTTPRPVGYLLPPNMASVVPKLLQHDIAVYGFRDSTQMDAEVYDATRVNRDTYFEGHYLKSVEVEKRAERIAVAPGWFWIPTAQSRANLISYLLEPETDDNLITWGWTDHVLQVRPRTVEEGLAAYAESNDLDLASLPEARRAQVRGMLERQLSTPQRVPMMRVMTHQPLPVVRVWPTTTGLPNRGIQP